MAMASAKAIPRIMFVWITVCASGLRPSASIAFDTNMPMPIAGPAPPMPMATPAPMNLIASSVISNSGISPIRSIIPPFRYPTS